MASRKKKGYHFENKAFDKDKQIFSNDAEESLSLLLQDCFLPWFPAAAILYRIRSDVNWTADNRHDELRKLKSKPELFTCQLGPRILHRFYSAIDQSTDLAVQKLSDFLEILCSGRTGSSDTKVTLKIKEYDKFCHFMQTLVAQDLVNSTMLSTLDEIQNWKECPVDIQTLSRSGISSHIHTDLDPDQIHLEFNHQFWNTLKSSLDSSVTGTSLLLTDLLHPLWAKNSDAERIWGTAEIDVYEWIGVIKDNLKDWKVSLRESMYSEVTRVLLKDPDNKIHEKVRGDSPKAHVLLNQLSALSSKFQQGDFHSVYLWSVVKIAKALSYTTPTSHLQKVTSAIGEVLLQKVTKMLAVKNASDVEAGELVEILTALKVVDLQNNYSKAAARLCSANLTTFLADKNKSFQAWQFYVDLAHCVHKLDDNCMDKTFIADFCSNKLLSVTTEIQKTKQKASKQDSWQHILNIFSLASAAHVQISPKAGTNVETLLQEALLSKTRGVMQPKNAQHATSCIYDANDIMQMAETLNYKLVERNVMSMRRQLVNLQLSKECVTIMWSLFKTLFRNSHQFLSDTSAVDLLNELNNKIIEMYSEFFSDDIQDAFYALLDKTFNLHFDLGVMPDLILAMKSLRKAVQSLGEMSEPVYAYSGSPPSTPESDTKTIGGLLEYLLQARNQGYFDPDFNMIIQGKSLLLVYLLATVNEHSPIQVKAENISRFVALGGNVVLCHKSIESETKQMTAFDVMVANLHNSEVATATQEILEASSQGYLNKAREGYFATLYGYSSIQPLSLAALTSGKAGVLLLLDAGALINCEDGNGNFLHTLVNISTSNKQLALRLLDPISKFGQKSPANQMALVSLLHKVNPMGQTPIEMAIHENSGNLLNGFLTLTAVCNMTFQNTDNMLYDLQMFEGQFDEICCKSESYVDESWIDAQPRKDVSMFSLIAHSSDDDFKCLKQKPVRTLLERKVDTNFTWYVVWGVIHVLMMAAFTVSRVGHSGDMPALTLGGTDAVIIARAIAEFCVLLYVVILVVFDILDTVWNTLLSTTNWRFLGRICSCPEPARGKLLTRCRLFLKYLCIYYTKFRMMLLIFAFLTIVHFICAFASAAVSRVFFSLAVLFGWSACLFFNTGSYMSVMFFKLGMVIVHFLVLFAFILLGFSAALYALLQTSASPLVGFESYGHAILTLVRLTLGLTDLDVFEQSYSPAIAYILYVLFLVIAIIHLLSMVIAAMVNMQGQTAEYRDMLWKKEIAIIIDLLERRSPSCLHRRPYATHYFGRQYLNVLVPSDKDNSNTVYDERSTRRVSYRGRKDHRDSKTQSSTAWEITRPWKCHMLSPSKLSWEMTEHSAKSYTRHRTSSKSHRRSKSTHS